MVPVALTSPFTVNPETAGAILPPMTIPEFANVILLVTISLNIPIFINGTNVDKGIEVPIITE